MEDSTDWGGGHYRIDYTKEIPETTIPPAGLLGLNGYESQRFAWSPRTGTSGVL